ncbi:ATP-binding cassette subfamily C member 4-like [Chrysoperla carnea]|uniref:ATP-binding cassette subfamily C member 4-like n=1 Tax=Chrysoperla carnea TaxID=189513 RepID=UPI001D06B239|nr:ATP-binding cassette subfamily C member 4-like [Chrysoperla carnea]
MNSTIQYQMRKNPKNNANIISKISLSWLVRLFVEGRKKNFNIEDLYEISERNQSKTVGDLLEKHWNEELSKYATDPNYKLSLTKALFKTFYPSMMIQFGLLFFLQVVISVLAPIFIGHLIENYSQYQNGITDDYFYVYLFGTLIFLNTFVSAFIQHNYAKSTLLLGMKVRVACCSLIYRKMLRLKLSALSQTSNGQITNLLSNDVNRFDNLFYYFYHIFTIPFQLIVVLIITWMQIQSACLTGFLILVMITIPVQGFIGKKNGALRQKIAKLTDRRVLLMNEIISGIQVIKMYAWEIPFEKFVEIARFNEIKKIKTSNYYRAASFSGVNFTERITIFTATVTFTLLGNALNSVKVFSMYQCFKIFQRSVSFYYPTAMLMTTETIVSIKRIQTFLQLEEQDFSNIIPPSAENNHLSIKASPCIEEKSERGDLVFENYTGSWLKNNPVLKNISTKIKNGEICTIIGPVGSGKSSLLHGILNEVNVDNGNIFVNGTVSYSCQESWLFSGSVRNNILFGLPYDDVKYKQVVEACSLAEDFLQFPYADNTLVGDKGASLSGGQKARINLARAIYRDADIYLLDDPLSAVDANVGKHIFQECFENYLGNKTRILVTHQIQHLKNVDHIIVLKNGEIEAEGTYDELVAKNLEFTKYLRSNTDENDESKNNNKQVKNSKNKEVITASVESLKPKIKDEEMSKNKIKTHLFYKYFMSAGNIWWHLALCFLMILSQLINNFTDYWLSYWTNLEEVRQKNKLNPLEIIPLNGSDSTHVSYELDDHLMTTGRAILIYGILLIVIVFLGFAKNAYLMSLCMRSSRNLHNTIFNLLCRAPMRFFDKNPVGRILNRFTKDMGAVDEILPKSFMHTWHVISVLIGIGTLISIVNPILLIPTIILILLIIKTQDIYMMTAQDIKRLEGITKSPVFSHTSSTLEGLTTIRASRVEKELLDEYDQHQDVHTAAAYLAAVCGVILGLWVDMLCGFYLMTVTTSLVFFYRTHFTGSEIGLALSQALNLLFVVQFGIKEASEMINQMTGVERILEYTKIKSEGPFDTPEDTKVPETWPNNGVIKFNKLCMRYEETEPNILKEISLDIHSGEKIGVVGRTGAGKSSFISSLFRLAIIDGEIIIDDVNITKIGLHDLRSKISIIPQQPVLFSATLRFNLDPFNKYEDHVLWDVLEEVKLKNVVTSLDFEVQSGGTNFSIGQRQLICLARAILKQNKILVLDEATANVDPHTDALIQQTIRDKFKSCTVITIAHRLNTIMDSDKVLVMDAGFMVEFDHPQRLLQNKNGVFYKLHQESNGSQIFHNNNFNS